MRNCGVIRKENNFLILNFVPECNWQFHHEHLWFVLEFEVIFHQTSPRMRAALGLYIDRFQDPRQILSKYFGLSLITPLRGSDLDLELGHWRKWWTLWIKVFFVPKTPDFNNVAIT